MREPKYGRQKDQFIIFVNDEEFVNSEGNLWDGRKCFNLVCSAPQTFHGERQITVKLSVWKPKYQMWFNQNTYVSATPKGESV